MTPMPQPHTASTLPGAKDTFIFQSYAFDEQTWSLAMVYAYQNGPSFEETIQFAAPTSPLSDAARQALDHACRLLFLLAGISYYKAAIPIHLKCDAFPLDQDTADFLKEVYLKGLGEFSYRNQLDLSNRLHFAVEKSQPANPVQLPEHTGYLVPVGGGKDSIVSIETLKRQSEAVTLFALSSVPQLPGPIQGTIDVSRLAVQVVTRKLSPVLFELNQAGAYNGHIPITAILSMIAICTAIIQGQKYIVLSNENSASAANLIYKEMEINHQYSKSFAFELALSDYIRKNISPDIVYFSLLRPLTEADISRRFAKETAYHGVFRSCNTAFRQDAAKRATQWCCDCPKCRFVFLALSNFMPKDQLIQIFGKNLLSDEAQLEGFSELCGLSAHKPFECVGEIEESALLMEYLCRQPEWSSDIIVTSLGSQLSSQRQNFETDYQALFALQKDHAIPPHLLRLLDERR